MTGKKHPDENTSETRPDELQREIWQYRRFWVGIIILLVAARIILPHTPLLRGWEQKFSAAALESGKKEIPPDALKVVAIEAANAIFKPKLEIPADMANLQGPILIAAWKCEVLGEDGGCLRYLWKDDTLTMVVLPGTHKAHKTHGAFSRTGWGGYFIVDKGEAATLVGPFDPSDILNTWPYALKFANSPGHP
jgi:hypothetical protein